MSGGRRGGYTLDGELAEGAHALSVKNAGERARGTAFRVAGLPSLAEIRHCAGWRGKRKRRRQVAS